VQYLLSTEQFADLPQRAKLRLETSNWANWLRGWVTFASAIFLRANSIWWEIDFIRNFLYFSRKCEKLDFFIKCNFSGTIQQPEFRTLHVKSNRWEVNAHLILKINSLYLSPKKVESSIFAQMQILILSWAEDRSDWRVVALLVHNKRLGLDHQQSCLWLN